MPGSEVEGEEGDPKDTFHSHQGLKTCYRCLKGRGNWELVWHTLCIWSEVGKLPSGKSSMPGRTDYPGCLRVVNTQWKSLLQRHKVSTAKPKQVKQTNKAKYIFGPFFYLLAAEPKLSPAK